MHRDLSSLPSGEAWHGLPKKPCLRLRSPAYPEERPGTVNLRNLVRDLGHRGTDNGVIHHKAPLPLLELLPLGLGHLLEASNAPGMHGLEVLGVLERSTTQGAAEGLCKQLAACLVLESSASLIRSSRGPLQSACSLFSPRVRSSRGTLQLSALQLQESASHCNFKSLPLEFKILKRHRITRGILPSLPRLSISHLFKSAERVLLDSGCKVGQPRLGTTPYCWQARLPSCSPKQLAL
jgi:hypothetical protein